MKNGVSTTLDDLIKAALTGQPYNQRRLGIEAQKYARRLSNAKAPDLAEDLHEDICQQAFLELFRAGPDDLAERSGKALFRRAVLAAVRIVRAAHAPPGERTRHTKDPSPARVAAEAIGQIVDQSSLARSGLADAFGSITDVGAAVDPAAAAKLQQVEDALDVFNLLQGASADIAAALKMIHQDDEAVGAAAAAIGLDRFTFNRRLNGFFASARLAA